jgi:CRISPR-associated endonuclease/helicase Cas3
VSTSELLKYWGKSAGEDHSLIGHPVVYHSLDVAAVADEILERRPLALSRFAELVGIDPSIARAFLVALVSLHDLGKFAPAFQAKVPALWPDSLGDFPGPPPPRYHTQDGWVLWDSVLQDRLQPRLWPASRRILTVLGVAVFGHHGRPVPASTDSAARRFGGALDSVLECADHLVGLLSPSAIWAGNPDRVAIRVASWWVAGLVTTADWIASGSRHFNHDWFVEARSIPSETGFEAYLEAARLRAVDAVREAGLVQPLPSQPMSFSSLMKPVMKASSPEREWELTAMQAWAETATIPEGPALFILEDVTGSGKTEAAHMLVHRLMCEGRATGAYWAMPTLATANAMYERQAVAIAQLYSDGGVRPSLVLAHRQQRLHSGFRSTVLGSQLLEAEAGDHSDEELSGALACGAFLANDARASFLADSGAGTVDQAILGVLPSKFNTMRLFGLCEKVLVIDEAHAYDAYVLREVDQLLRFQAALGGSAIVLSATLNTAGRKKLTDAWTEGLRQRKGCDHRNDEAQADTTLDDAYPLVTVLSASGATRQAQAAAEWATRKVPVRLIHEFEQAADYVVQAQQAGAAVVWIRNTVADCIAAADELSQRGLEPIVFHARFAQFDRQRIEERVLSLFGKEANSSERRGKVLVATQVVEQSLDLDFDALVTDIAPIDLIIQRIGRFRRHSLWNALRPGELAEEVVILSPPPDDNPPAEWLAGEFKRTAYVYDHPGILWRTVRALANITHINVPKGIRGLVNAIYDSDEIPEAFISKGSKSEGESKAADATASYGVLEPSTGYEHGTHHWLSDLRIPTRLGAATTTVRLARVGENGDLSPWANEVEDSRHSWALSEVRVYSYQVPLGSQPLSRYSEAAARAKKEWGRFETELPLLPLGALADGDWEGSLVTPSGMTVNVRYSTQFGLTISRT